jgi:hypothetical protein
MSGVKAAVSTLLVLFLSATISIGLIPHITAQIIESNPRTITIIVSKDGFNRTADIFPINVTLGEVIVVRFVYGDTDLPYDNPHQMYLEGYGIETEIISRENPVTTIEFRADTVGKFRFYCAIGCLGMENLQGGVLNVYTQKERKHTYLILQTPPLVVQGSNVSIRVTLMDESLQPVRNATVNLYVKDTFGGKVRIASIRTDERGEARRILPAHRMGVIRVEAEYPGGIIDGIVMNASRAEDNFYVVSDRLGVLGKPIDNYYNWGIWAFNRPHEDHVQGIYTETPASLLAISTVYTLILIVYGIFAYVLYQLRLILKEGD